MPPLRRDPQTCVPLHRLSLQLNLTSSVINQSFEVLFFFPSLPCFFPGAIFSPLLVFSTFIPLNSDSGGILSVTILSGLNFRLVSKELFYLCFNKALGESNSEDKFLEAVSSPVKHSQPLLPQDKESYHLHAPHPSTSSPFSAGFTWEYGGGFHSLHTAPTWT